MSGSDEQRPTPVTEYHAWHELLDLIELFVWGPGEAGFEHLTNDGPMPRIATPDEIRAFASKWEFDLPTAVRSLKEVTAKFDRDGLTN